MPAPVVVEVYSPQPRPQELAALIAACTRAAAPNECITSDVRTSESPLGVAIVRRDGDRARIELGLRGVVTAEWSTRDLVFQPADDELERYRAIGFAIGTLVTRKVEPAAPEPEVKPAAVAPPPQAKPAEPAKPPPPPAPPRSRSTWIDVSGGVGLGLIPGSPRWGGTLRAASELVPGGLFGVAETSYSQGSAEPSLSARWLGLSLGVGHPLTSRARSLGVDARLQLVLERLSLTATDGERSDGTLRWKPGVSVGLDAHWQALPPLALLAGAVANLDPARTVIEVQGVQVAETPALGIGGFVGLRLKLR